MRHTKSLLALGLILALLLGGCAGDAGSEGDADGLPGGIVVDAPRTSLNPLTGLYNMPDDNVGNRPIAISIDNLSGAWPQYGISEADIIFEIETEGGITRLLALYADSREVEKIGPVRSLRDPFLEAVYPYDAIVVHIGTSIYAEEVIAQYNYPTLDGGAYASTIWTDTERLEEYASEHCKFTGGEAIQKGISAAKLPTETDFTGTAFNFTNPDETYTPTSGAATQINYIFSNQYSGYYDGDFRYDEATGKYLKYQHGEAQKDAGNNNEQLAFDNLFLLFADIGRRDNTELIELDYSAGGTGYYFSGGSYVEIIWQKSDFGGNFIFTIADTGEELRVNCGKTHVGIVNKRFASQLEISA